MTTWNRPWRADGAVSRSPRPLPEHLVDYPDEGDGMAWYDDEEDTDE